MLIKAFRKWKGKNYIPKNVHKAICWSKHDPLNESEIFDDWIIKTKNTKQNSTLNKQNNTIEKQDSTLKPYKFITNEPHSKKCKLENINKTIYEKHEMISSPKKIHLN